MYQVQLVSKGKYSKIKALVDKSSLRSKKSIPTNVHDSRVEIIGGLHRKFERTKGCSIVTYIMGIYSLICIPGILGLHSIGENGVYHDLETPL